MNQWFFRGSREEKGASGGLASAFPPGRKAAKPVLILFPYLIRLLGMLLLFCRLILRYQLFKERRYAADICRIMPILSAEMQIKPHPFLILSLLFPGNLS